MHEVNTNKTMKNIIFSIKKTVIMASLSGLALFAFIPVSTLASTSPTLSISSLNNGTVQMNISGDSDAQIYLYYYTTSVGTISLGTIGSTAQNGYLSTTLSPYMNVNSPYAYTGASYNAALASIPYGASVYVVIDGLQSGTVAWPLSPNGSIISPNIPVNVANGISFNQSNLNLTVGQSQTIQIYQSSGVYNGSNYNYGGTYYVSSNTNSAVVSASVSGSSLSIYALTSGSATITVCSNGISYSYANGQCATLYVMVSYSGTGYNSYSGYNYPTAYNYPTTSYATNYSYPTTYTNPVINVTPVISYIPATVYNTFPTYPTYNYSYSSPVYSYSTPTYYPY
jgi:hypothetical protein